MSLYNMPCVLFAGGKSSRMGEDKAFLPFGGYDSLVEYQIKRLEKMFKNVYVSAKDKNKFKAIDTVIIEDILHPEVYAPTSGFINAFATLTSENSFFVLSVDTPFVNKKTISKFLEVCVGDYDAIIARTPSRVHPLCGIYTRKLEGPLKQMMKDDNHKLMMLLKNAKVLYIDITEEDCFLNLNTPDEYQRALELLKTL